MNENEKEKLLEEGYESVKFRASDFLPNGKLANGDEIIDLHTKDLHIEYMGKLRQLIAVFDVTGVLAQCPLCYAPCDEKSYVIMTDSHMLYPCWSCDKLVEKERSDDFPEAFA
tara:strand:- start:410 stop:748 length:339 start_codon:yes stop_codon:yes gene_type:complete